jgi:hypothetical protein
MFGSGSTEKKKYNDRLWFKKKKKISTNNLTDIYAVMQSFESLPQDFNLEGVIYTGRLVFIQSW